MKERNIVVDIMKGVAILSVMIGHAQWIPGFIHTFIFSFHIPLFFIISGYYAKTYEENQLNRSGYIRRNAKQLLIPYLIVSVVLCLYSGMQAYFHRDTSILLHEVIRQFVATDTLWEGTLFDEGVGPIWFLLALFWARILFYYVSYLGKCFIPLCVALSITMILLHPYIPTPFCIGRGIEALMFVGLGWMYHKYRVPLWIKISAVLCWCISMYMGDINLYAYKFNFLPIDIVGACGGTLVIYYISKGIAKTVFYPLFSWFGRNSLIILCAHSIEYSITIVHVITKIIPFRISQVLYYGIRHGVTILGAWMYTKIRRHI